MDFSPKFIDLMNKMFKFTPLNGPNIDNLNYHFGIQRKFTKMIGMHSF